MASALAIISKAVFEKLAPGARPGTVVALDRYASTHKSLELLGEGGALYLVTVRPPDEQLWLVAVLEAPELDKSGWRAGTNRVAIADVSRLRSKLKFSTGAGIQAKPGALGMSLQTPRVLTEADVTLLRGLTGAAAPAKPGRSATTKPVAGGPGKPAAATPGTPGSAKPGKPVAAKPGKPVTAKPGKAVVAKPGKPGAAVGPIAAARAATAVASADPGAVPGGDLAALQAAFAAKDGAAALTTALAWWRTQRAPALADLIEAISEQVSGAPVTTDLEFTKLAMAKRSLDLGRLLPAIPGLPVSFLPTAAELLAVYPDDPRIAKAVSQWALVPITTSTSKYTFWTRMFETTVRIGDARVVPIFKKWLAGAARRDAAGAGWEKFDKAIERVLAKLPAAPAFDARPLAKLAVGKLSPITSGAVVRPAEPAVELTGPWLAQATTHLKAGRVAAAIGALLERWRETRVPALADLIDRATRLLPTHDLPLAPSAKELQATWMAAVDADPQGAMPQLLQHVNRGEVKLRELRIAQLATLPDDPRIAIRLTELAPGGADAKAGSYWKRLFEAIAKTRDVRTCAHLRRDFRDFTSTYFYHHATGRRIVSKFAIHPETAFDTWPLELAPDDRKLVGSLELVLAAAEAKATSRERALIAAIAESPDDDLPRQVYADWLMERGHPRGELITLACKAQRTDAETARLAELAQVPYVHGTLEDFATDLEHERGIVRTLVHGFDTSSLTWRALASYPLLAVVETLDVSEYLSFPLAEDFARVLANAPSLRRIKGMRGELEGEDGAALTPIIQGRWKLVGDDLVRA